MGRSSGRGTRQASGSPALITDTGIAVTEPLEDPSDEHTPTVLERMALPFDVEDTLAEPFESFFVVRVTFGAQVLPETLGHLEQILDAWLQANVEAAHRMGEQVPAAEIVQVGPRSVEFHIYGACGDPDVEMVPMLRRLAEWRAAGQIILLVELE